ncbi:Divalent-cation tolerance protein CutA [Roseobacter fucihabitans]|uniref:Divalent-cation tolerance protein CutA n=1 Tax=Roseobacter fucihabitans TaxID=1537242 RepID=A0ABZ2BX18_9RHOB|nr:divalent-cation tolerance protein CutA [Roseobacter litoralis]MBC6966849.1 Divalent-cation tolerance protein CutA [Roseobacter litoralis]
MDTPHPVPYPPRMHIIDITVNCPSIETADAISAALIEPRLVACSNRYPAIQSAYFWDGAVAREEEHPLHLKTRAALGDAVEAAVRALHPYAVPPIIRINIDHANDDYIAWVCAETCAP